MPWLIFFLTTLSTLAHAFPCATQLAISDDVGLPSEETSRLFQTACETLNQFEKKTGDSLDHSITLKIAKRGCLRVGYDFVSQMVVFCSQDGGNKPVKHFGLNSVSVIRHELFHAVTCQFRPEICQLAALKDETTNAILEGTADFFAYLLHPENEFGTDFYEDGSSLRKYGRPLCYSLTEGPHGKGEALASALIHQGYGWSDLSRLLHPEHSFSLASLLTQTDSSCFAGVHSPIMNYSVKDHAASPLHRYWTSPGVALQFRFQPNASLLAQYPLLKLSWSSSARPPLFEILQNSPTAFRLNPLSARGHGEFLVSYSYAGQVVGFRKFRLGIRKIPPP